MALRKKPTLLFAGGSYSDIPLIREAKSLGFFVVSTGLNPRDLGHRYSDRYIQADYSDKEQMLALAKDVGANCVCACCNDFSEISVAFVAECLGLPGHDNFAVCQVLHHKDRFREYASRTQVRVPKAIGAICRPSSLRAIEEIGFPAIIKPVDLTGGKGISVVRSLSEANRAVDTALKISRAGRIVVEQYLEGSRHGLTVLLRNQKVAFHFADDEHYYQNPFLVSGASCPTSMSIAAQNAVCEMAEKIAADLSLVDGILHTQLIMHRDEPVLIEVCRRAPGDLYVEFVRYATGVNYARWIVAGALGMSYSALSSQYAKMKLVTRHCIMSPCNGTLDTITIAPEIADRIVDATMWWKHGDIVNCHLTQKHGIVFIEHNSILQMHESLPRLTQLIKVTMKAD